jgi:hypothetical protein
MQGKKGKHTSKSGGRNAISWEERYPEKGHVSARMHRRFQIAKSRVTGMGHRGAQRITSGVTEIEGALHQGLLLSLAKWEAGANKAVSVTKNGSQTIRRVSRG